MVHARYEARQHLNVQSRRGQSARIVESPASGGKAEGDPVGLPGDEGAFTRLSSNANVADALRIKEIQGVGRSLVAPVQAVVVANRQGRERVGTARPTKRSDQAGV